MNVAQVADLERGTRDVRVDARHGERSLYTRFDGDDPAQRLLELRQRRQPHDIECRLHRKIRDRCVELLDASGHRRARALRHQVKLLERDVVLTQVELTDQPIDSGVLVLDVHLSVGRFECDLVPIGQVVAVYFDRGEGQPRIDLLCTVFVADGGVAD